MLENVRSVERARGACRSTHAQTRLRRTVTLTGPETGLLVQPILGHIGRKLSLASFAGVVASIASCGDSSGTCEEANDTFELLEPAVEDGDGGVLDRSHDPCEPLCRSRLAAREFYDCTAPELVEVDAGLGPSYWQGRRWKVACHVEVQVCKGGSIDDGNGSGCDAPHGRRTAGGPVGRSFGEDECGRWLAEAALLEAASIPAFERLGRELMAHRAPIRLVRAARRSMREEELHTRLVSQMARRHGARVRRSRILRLPVRPLESVAIENAREGCVHETIGAILATYQARHARTAEMRALMTTLARDEIRHGALAWEVFAWSLDQLSAAARVRVRDALCDAAAKFDSASITSATESAGVHLGLPSREHAHRLLARSRAFFAAWS